MTAYALVLFLQLINMPLPQLVINGPITFNTQVTVSGASYPIDLGATDCTTVIQDGWDEWGWTSEATPLQQTAASQQFGDICRNAAPTWPSESL